MAGLWSDEKPTEAPIFQSVSELSEHSGRSPIVGMDKDSDTELLGERRAQGVRKYGREQREFLRRRGRAPRGVGQGQRSHFSRRLPCSFSPRVLSPSLLTTPSRFHSSSFVIHSDSSSVVYRHPFPPSRVLSLSPRGAHLLPLTH
jgi:hypothetical protein